MASTASLRTGGDRTCRFRRIQGNGFRLVMEITHRCNLRCKHCFVPKEKLGPSTQQIIHTIQEAAQAGCQKIILTGGEPLLRSDLETMIEACARLNILVDLNSNLTLLTRERARRLLGAGIGEVSASIHGSRVTHDWLSGQDGCYDQTIRGIELLLENGIMVDVHSALWDDALDQGTKLASLCERLGIGSLTFFQIIPSDHAPFAPDTFILTQHKALEAIAEVRSKSNIPIRTVGLCASDFSECVMSDGLIGVDANFRLVACLLARGPASPLPTGEFDSRRVRIQSQVADGQWRPICVNEV